MVVSGPLDNFDSEFFFAEVESEFVILEEVERDEFIGGGELNFFWVWVIFKDAHSQVNCSGGRDGKVSELHEAINLIDRGADVCVEEETSNGDGVA
jgi:hypothetical protein